MLRIDRYLVLFETMCPDVYHPSESRTFMYYFFSISKAPLFIFCYLFAYYINKTYSFELKHNNMKTKKWLHMKKEHNTFKDSSQNHNFTIRTVICDFFPYPITEIPTGMKGTEKIHLVQHHSCFFFSPQYSGVSLYLLLFWKTSHILPLESENVTCSVVSDSFDSLWPYGL